MHNPPDDTVSPALWAVGTLRGTSIRVWVEAPSDEELQKLEATNGCVAGTCAVSSALLEVALIKWVAQHGEVAAATWTELACGYKVPMPVVRRFDGGMLRLVSGAPSVLALRAAQPTAEGTFPALVVMS